MGVSKIIGYRCSLCRSEYTPASVSYVCPVDGGNLDVVLDYQNIQQNTPNESILTSTEASIWRYLPLLPVSDPNLTHTPMGAVGMTPTFRPPLLVKQQDMPNLWVKDESRNPTASFKDRASAVVIARARDINAEIVVTASTGNAGAALAGMAAAANHRAVIFAPKTAPPAKVAQLLVYGAQVILVDGNYDSAFDLTIQAAAEFGWYCRNTGYNPYTLEGKKTAAFEIWEWWEKQLRTRLDISELSVIVSVGDGNIISGLHKGFKDLVELGWIDRLPRIIGVQAAGSAAIADAFAKNTEDILPVSANTIADSIAVDYPRDGVRAVRATKETGGFYLVVQDEEILAAIAALGKAGIFAEPAGATAYAGLVKGLNAGLIDRQDAMVVLNTGSGLKDIAAARSAVAPAPVIEPRLEALKSLLKI